MASPVLPSIHTLNSWQKLGLEAVSRLNRGRDVVLAIDLTESVGLNDVGRQYLRQIIQKTLKPGDTIYIIPFASHVYPAKEFTFSSERDSTAILEAIPLNASTERTTDIQCAELNVYRYIASLNQARLANGQPVKPQSVVWVSDAPLNLEPGRFWIETPESVCGQIGTADSQERLAWMQRLPMQQRQVPLGGYALTVVDIPPTVQEFCTPRPGGGDACLVDSYLLDLLWKPGLIVASCFFLIIALGSWWLVQQLGKSKPWRISVSSSEGLDHTARLKDGQMISFGEDLPGSKGSIPLSLLGTPITLKRKNNKIFLAREPSFSGGVSLNGVSLIGEKEISINGSNEVEINDGKDILVEKLHIKISHK